MQQKDNKRNKGMSRAQQLKHKKDMELPINKFLNEKDEEGNFKYPLAEKLRKYYVYNPDPILADLRRSNALLREVRWRLELADYHFKKHEVDNAATYIETDNDGNKIVKKHYGGYVSEKQTVHLVLAKMRAHLSERLLSKCDGDFFTFDQYQDFVTKTEKILSDMGYVLFPVEVKLIEPL